MSDRCLLLVPAERVLFKSCLNYPKNICNIPAFKQALFVRSVLSDLPATHWPHHCQRCLFEYRSAQCHQIPSTSNNFIVHRLCPCCWCDLVTIALSNLTLCLVNKVQILQDECLIVTPAIQPADQSAKQADSNDADLKHVKMITVFGPDALHLHSM